MYAALDAAVLIPIYDLLIQEYNKATTFMSAKKVQSKFICVRSVRTYSKYIYCFSDTIEASSGSPIITKLEIQEYESSSAPAK